MSTPKVVEISNSLSRKEKEVIFKSLLEDNKENVYWLTRKMVLLHDDANDVTQNVFMKVWQNLDKFKGESSHSTWIHRIAVNESLNFLAKKKKLVKNSPLNEHLFNELCADVYFDGDEELKKFHKALLTLPEKQRLVFNLKYFEQRKYSEIAEMTETSEGALKASYHIAVKKIKELLTHE